MKKKILCKLLTLKLCLLSLTLYVFMPQLYLYGNTGNECSTYYLAIFIILDYLSATDYLHEIVRCLQGGNSSLKRERFRQAWELRSCFLKDSFSSQRRRDSKYRTVSVLQFCPLIQTPKTVFFWNLLS